MKTTRMVALILSFVVVAWFGFPGEVTAKPAKQSGAGKLAAIKDKRKVFVSAVSPAQQQAIAELLKRNAQLEVVERPQEAEFFLTQSEKFDYQIDQQTEVSRNLPRLASAEVSEAEQQRRFKAHNEGLRKTRSLGIMKNEVEVYFLKSDGAKAIVWSKTSADRVSSIPALPPDRPSSSLKLREPAYYYTHKDPVLKLTNRFIKDLKRIQK